MRAIDVKSFEIEKARAVPDGWRDTASRYLGIAAFNGLLVTIFVFAIPYGTVEVWHKAALTAAIAVLAGFRIIDGVLRGGFRITEPVILLPMAGVILLAIAQIIPWSGRDSVISADPYETVTFIWVFGGLIIVGEILYFYADSKRRLKTLIGLVLVVGVGSALFGILRALFLDGQSTFLAQYLTHEQGFAQFINRNHFAVLIEMTLGLTLGLVMKADLAEKFKFFGWVLLGLLVYAIITANSRGGIISLAALSVFAAFVHIVSRGKDARDERFASSHTGGPSRIKRTLAAVAFSGLIFGFVVVMIAFVGGDRVVTRIEKIEREVEPVDNLRVNRHLIWTSTVDLIRERPILGSGFGGYAAAIPAFDRSGGKFSLKQAHNDYLEILANGGLAGSALFSIFGVLVVLRVLKNLNSRDTFRRASCFGAAIGIFGVMIHSFVDFGLHIMINALIFIVLIVIATADIDETVSH